MDTCSRIVGTQNIKSRIGTVPKGIAGETAGDAWKAGCAIEGVSQGLATDVKSPVVVIYPDSILTI